MSSNHKLTAVLQGLTIQHFLQAGATLTIGLNNGAVMTILTGVPAEGSSLGKVIMAVRQAGTELDLDFAEDSSLTVTTAEATASVMVRDSAGKIIYAD